MTVSKERAMQMFDRDLEMLMDDLRGMQAHYQIADWEAFVFLRKPDCPRSYVVKYAAADDEFAKRVVRLHTTPPETPAAAMRAAEEIATFLFEEYPDNDMDRDGATGHVAAIITRHLPARADRLFEAKLLGFGEDDRIRLCEPCVRRATDDNFVIFACALPLDAAATTSPETPVGGHEAPRCVRCGHDDGVDDNGTCLHLRYAKRHPAYRNCKCKCEFAPVVATADDEGELLTDDDCALVAHAINTARQIQEFIWADCYPALRPYDADGWQRLFQKRVDCIAEVDLSRHGGLAALRKRLLQQAALSIKALALVNRWAKANPPSSPDGADLRDAALNQVEGKGK